MIRGIGKTENDDVGLEPTAPPLTDTEAKELIRQELTADSGTVLQTFDRKTWDTALRKLKAAGLTVRQIERLTGINRGIVQRA